MDSDIVRENIKMATQTTWHPGKIMDTRMVGTEVVETTCTGSSSFALKVTRSFPSSPSSNSYQAANNTLIFFS